MYPYQNPNYYYYQPQMYPYFQRMPKKFNLQHTLHTTIRGIQIANQVIPIIYQVKPLIDNTKQGLTLLKTMNHLNDIDFDEIEKELKPISKENNEIFENMLVKGIVPRGYCKGVVRAIEIAKKQVHQTTPVYILGMIVHNQYIVNALEDLGIQTIDIKGKTRLELLDEINEGKVIITAHGASQKVFDKAKEKGLEVIDASCLDVIKTHDLIQDKLNEGYEILYIGKKGHPEAEGAISIDEKRIHLITNRDDLKTIDPTKKYVMTNQTTMSLYDVYDLCEKAKEILPFVEIEKETCTATKIRQEAIKNIEDDVDIIFIVGDPHSNNTRKLASIAHDYHTCDVYMIESIEDLKIEWLKNKRYAAVSSGASTPTYLTNQVIDYLKQFDINDSKTYQKPIIDKNKILNQKDA